MSNSGEINIKIGGEAGFGIMTSGLILAKTATRSGYHIFDYSEYPSLIRGGHNTYQVRISKEEIFSQVAPIDILIALDRQTINLHQKDLAFLAGVMFDSSEFSLGENLGRSRVTLLPIPLGQISKKIGGDTLMRNTIALGAVLKVLDGDLNILFGVIKDIFGSKGKTVVEKDMAAARAGFLYARKFDKTSFRLRPKPGFLKRRLVLTGNEAVSLGALRAGCKFLAAYPMTPASSILHTLAAEGPQYKMVVKQTEDEISAINMALGASFAGVRSLVATSGGGYSLMVEATGLSGMTETPLVIVEAARPGPATGLPTWTEQADLKFLINAAQGEFPRIVLAPGDVWEAFYLTSEAFNLAEKYQIPVFVLLDKYLSESHKSLAKSKIEKAEFKIDRGQLLSNGETKKSRNYKRYKLTAGGVSPRAFPGQKKGVHLANSDEHDEYGYSSEDSQNRTRMVDKRFKKLAGILGKIPRPHLFGPKKADLTLIGWGSTKGPILEAMKKLNASQNPAVNFWHFSCVWPIVYEEASKIFDLAKKTVIVENNKMGQFASIIREQIGRKTNHEILKYDGRPFYPEEIASQVRNLR